MTKLNLLINAKVQADIEKRYFDSSKLSAEIEDLVEQIDFSKYYGTPAARYFYE